MTLPQGWAWTTLGEIADTTRRRSLPQEHPDLPFIGMENIEAQTMRLLGTVPAVEMKSSAEHFEPGDVLYGRLRPYLNKVFCPEFEGLCSSEFIVFRRSSHLASEYLQYFLNSWNFVTFASHLNIGDRPRVNFDQVAEYPFPFAPLSEQYRIVAEIEKQFTRLDAGVAALKRAQANLKRYKASVLKAACEGRLAPQDPNDEPASELLARILEQRRKGAVTKRKGAVTAPQHEPALPDRLPRGWCWATWEQISPRVTVGFVGPMKHEYIEDGVPFLGSQNVREHRFDPEGLCYISPAFHRKISKSVLHPGDLVVVRSGSVGVTCVIPDTVPEANCADPVVIQKPACLEPAYGSYYMNSLAKRHVRAGQVGVALIHFNTKSVAALTIAVPLLAEQRRIVAEVERRLSVVQEVEAVIAANLARAERLRQSILKQAFEGRLVAQDPNDEPASGLLERIRTERGPVTHPTQRNKR